MLRALHSLSAFIKKTVGTTMRDIPNLDVDQKAYCVVKSQVQGPRQFIFASGIHV